MSSDRNESPGCGACLGAIIMLGLFVAVIVKFAWPVSQQAFHAVQQQLGTGLGTVVGVIAGVVAFFIVLMLFGALLRLLGFAPPSK